MMHLEKISLKIEIVFITLCTLFLTAQIGNCQNLRISQRRGFMKDMVVFKIYLWRAPNDVQSFGFDLHFDPQILEYNSYKRGKVIEGYDFFECIQTKPGILRCGGFNKETENISAGHTGEMMILYFRKITCQNTVLSLEDLVDDMENWSTGEGRFFCLGR